MEGAILLIVAVGALGAFATGIVLLVLYFRSGRMDSDSYDPVIYGDLVQCPECGYMNPLESAACLKCHTPLPHPQGYQARQQFVQTYMGDQPQNQPYNPPNVPGNYVPPQAVQPAARPSAPPSPSGRPATPRPNSLPAAQPVPVSGRPAGMPRAWLEGTGGAMSGRHTVIQQADTLVGRSTVCDVQVYDPKVSRKHFRIRYGNGAFFMQDQQSSRGTLINGERVMAQRLSNGDRIDIGDTSMTFHVEG